MIKLDLISDLLSSEAKFFFGCDFKAFRSHKIKVCMGNLVQSIKYKQSINAVIILYWHTMFKMIRKCPSLTPNALERPAIN